MADIVAQPRRHHLGQRIAFIGRLQLARQYGAFLKRIGRCARIHAGTADIEQSWNAGLARRHDDVATHVEIVDQKPHRIGHVRLNSAHSAGGVDDQIRLGPCNIGFACRAVGEIKLRTPRCDQIVPARDSVVTYIATDHAAAACQKNLHEPALSGSPTGLSAIAPGLGQIRFRHLGHQIGE